MQAHNVILIYSDDGYADGSRECAPKGHQVAGPLRGGKVQIYEGGNRVPLIVSWPAKIKPGKSHPEKVEQLSKILVKIKDGAGVRASVAAGG